MSPHTQADSALMTAITGLLHDTRRNVPATFGLLVSNISVNPIGDWLQAKSIQPRNSSVSRERLAYLVAANIGRKEPRQPFIQPTSGANEVAFSLLDDLKRRLS